MTYSEHELEFTFANKTKYMYVSERDFLYESYTKIVTDARDVHSCYDTGVLGYSLISVMCVPRVDFSHFLLFLLLSNCPDLH